MKKISLITIFDVANFGTFLQALATAVTIQSFGAKVEILHYERPFKNTTYSNEILLFAECIIFISG